MFKCIKKLFKKKTEAEKIAEAQFDKTEYQIVKLENGHYTYNLKFNEGEYIRVNRVYDLEYLIEMLERLSKKKAEEKAIQVMKGEVIS